jgi:hypothetical protein
MKMHTVSIITLKTEAVYTSEKSVYFNYTTWHCIPEGFHLHIRSHENLKYHNLGFFLKRDVPQYKMYCRYYTGWLQTMCVSNTFIGNKVIATQKLNSRHCKEQLKMFYQHPCVILFYFCATITILLINVCNFSHHFNHPIVYLLSSRFIEWNKCLLLGWYSCLKRPGNEKSRDSRPFFSISVIDTFTRCFSRHAECLGLHLSRRNNWKFSH